VWLVGDRYLMLGKPIVTSHNEGEMGSSGVREARAPSRPRVAVNDDELFDGADNRRSEDEPQH
jgi:hypothetical protein